MGKQWQWLQTVVIQSACCRLQPSEIWHLTRAAGWNLSHVVIVVKWPTGLTCFLFYPKWSEGNLSTCFVKLARSSFLRMLVSLLLTSPFLLARTWSQSIPFNGCCLSWLFVKAFAHDESHLLHTLNTTLVNVRLLSFSLPPAHVLVRACVQVNGSPAKSQPERMGGGKWTVTVTCLNHYLLRPFLPPDFCPICTTAGEMDYFCLLIEEVDHPRGVTD